MRRTAIGSTAIPANMPYWSGGKNADRLRISEKEIYSMIDVYQTMCDYADAVTVQQLYGEMDKLYCALKLIEKFGKFPLFLKNAGLVFADLSGSGVFETPYSDLNARNIAVDQLIDNAISLISDTNLPETYPQEVVTWWTNIVVNQNYYIDLETGKKVKNPAIMAGMSGTDYDELCARLKEGGPYYLYVAASASLVDSEAAFFKKQQQNYTIDKLEAVGVGLTRSIMMNNINSGIIAATKGKNANTALAEFKQGKDPSIGDPFLIAMIIYAVASLITMITAIVNVKKANIEKETAEILGKANIDAQAPDYTDFGQTVVDNKTGNIIDKTTGEVVGNVNEQKGITDYIPYLLIGGAALLLMTS